MKYSLTYPQKQTCYKKNFSRTETVETRQIHPASAPSMSTSQSEYPVSTSYKHKKEKVIRFLHTYRLK